MFNVSQWPVSCRFNTDVLSEMWRSYRNYLNEVISSSFLGVLFQICQKPCYSGTSDFIKEILSKFGVTADWFRVGCPVEEIAKLVKPNTRVCLFLIELQ